MMMTGRKMKYCQEMKDITFRFRYSSCESAKTPADDTAERNLSS